MNQEAKEAAALVELKMQDLERAETELLQAKAKVQRLEAVELSSTGASPDHRSCAHFKCRQISVMHGFESTVLMLCKQAAQRNLMRLSLDDRAPSS